MPPLPTIVPAPPDPPGDPPDPPGPAPPEGIPPAPPCPAPPPPAETLDAEEDAVELELVDEAVDPLPEEVVVSSLPQAASIDSATDQVHTKLFIAPW
jgi:hypothetical protein